MTTTCTSATREMTKGRSLMALVDGSSALTSLSSLFAAMLEKKVTNFVLDRNVVKFLGYEKD